MQLYLFILLSLVTCIWGAPVPIRRSESSTSPVILRDAAPKYVVAHFMVGNSAPYTSQDWADDINQAMASGIDGFALNIGKDSYTPTQLDNA